jgi:hypothetical protein
MQSVFCEATRTICDSADTSICFVMRGTWPEVACGLVYLQDTLCLEYATEMVQGENKILQ